MTTIVLRRWHWLLFGVLWVVQLLGWWMILQKAPDGAMVLHFLQSLPAVMRTSLAISVTAGPAYYRHFGEAIGSVQARLEFDLLTTAQHPQVAGDGLKAPWRRRLRSQRVWRRTTPTLLFCLHADS
jgi:hypothetical protein